MEHSSCLRATWLQFKRHYHCHSKMFADTRTHTPSFAHVHNVVSVRIRNNMLASTCYTRFDFTLRRILWLTNGPWTGIREDTQVVCTHVNMFSFVELMDHELIVIFLERRTCFCTWTSSSSKSSYATNVTLEQQERSSTCSELTMADFLHSLNISPFNQPIQHTKQGFCLMRQICKILLNLVPMNLRFAFISNGNLDP